MSIAALILNTLIVILLGITIAYCWLLNRRIRILQDSRGELAQLLKHFDESTQRASESIIALQTASKKIGENIQFRIDKANYLIDDMAYLIDKGNKLSSELEAGFAVSRARVRAMDAEEAEQRAPEPPPAAKEPSAPEPADASRPKISSTVEALLERVIGRNRTAPDVPRGEPEVRGRSQAEHELLEMIRAGIKG